GKERVVCRLPQPPTGKNAPAPRFCGGARHSMRGPRVAASRQAATVGHRLARSIPIPRVARPCPATGTKPAVITAFLPSFFPILVNVATGIATVEPELRDVLRALGASRWQVIQKVGLPRSMPYFFASLKVAITVAFVGSIVAETVAANKGIGHLMLVASSRFE